MSQPPQDPLLLFKEWFEKARSHKYIKEANAVNLATASAAGKPSNRMVLLKDFSEEGFVFYTNLQSHKGTQLAENPFAAMCFYWEPLGYQVRIEGHIVAVDAQTADRYFASRPLKSRIGAWASKQSRPLESAGALLKNIAKQTARFISEDVPRPPFWSGFCLVPSQMEFWQKAEYRVHSRLRYTKNADGQWQNDLLYP
jgi:pyridoxamine 5'-phosphate oxidase